MEAVRGRRAHRDWWRICPSTLVIVLATALGPMMTMKRTLAAQDAQKVFQLPRPAHKGPTSLEGVLWTRRSVRDFAPGALTLAQIGQLLWAAQGITHADGFRAAPSAGALYPLELYLVVGDVDDLEPGVYRYRPRQHDLVSVRSGDIRRGVARAAVRQDWVADGAAIVLIAGVYERTTQKYGDRGIRYVHMEVGHAAQNVYLQAAALGLGTTFVGAFEDRRIAEVVGLTDRDRPLGLMPVGRIP